MAVFHQFASISLGAAIAEQKAMTSLLEDETAKMEPIWHLWVMRLESSTSYAIPLSPLRI